MTSTLIVCDTCAWSADEKTRAGRTGGEALAEAVEAAAPASLEVRRQSCLMGCEHPCNAAVTAPGKMTYVLGGFTPGPEAANALIAYAEAHGEAVGGIVPFRQWPQGVKGHFIARVPPLAPKEG